MRDVPRLSPTWRRRQTLCAVRAIALCSLTFTLPNLNVQSCSLVSFFLYSESNFRAAAPAAGCCCLPLMTALLSPLSASYLTFPLPCFSLFLFQIALSLNTEIAIIEGVCPCGENFYSECKHKSSPIKKRTQKKQILIWLHFFSLMLAGNE